MQQPRFFVSPNRAILLLVTVALLGTSVAACHKDRSRDVPNPCQGLKANPLTFDFVEAYGTPTPDTAYNNQTLALRGPGAPYTGFFFQKGGFTR